MRSTPVVWGALCLALLIAVILLPLMQDSAVSGAPEWLAQEPPRIAGRSYPLTDITFTPNPVWDTIERLPMIANVQMLDYNGDGRNEAVVCDIQQQAIFVYALQPDGSYAEHKLIDDLHAPACCHFVDFDGDQDLDVLVADLGDIFPNNERVGQALLYLNDNGTYRRHVLLDNVRRIADVRAADFDADGDMDLVVAEFGHWNGSLIYLEQTDALVFRQETLLNGSGAIHVPLADYDGDGDIDIATVLSQDEEEVWLLLNDGSGQFEKKLIFHDSNYELGSGGLITCDLDRDGDQDLLLPAGDNLERAVHYPQQYHGCYWLQNNGAADFTVSRIGDLPGTYAVAAGDIDGDQDIDLALVSMSNDFSDPDVASLVLLINDGHEQFTTRQVASAPIHLITCAIGDLNNDARNDILAGSLRIHPPFTQMGRIHAWIQEP